ncbi:MAG: hypothetical protein QME57_04475, partial [Patescibacteria group bacterium]|nr:hypothetical protein [Patescibacteria group bacterium]
MKNLFERQNSAFSQEELKGEFRKEIARDQEKLFLIISKARASRNLEEREIYRERLREKIRMGKVNRECLNFLIKELNIEEEYPGKFGVLYTKEIVDFLIPRKIEKGLEIEREEPSNLFKVGEVLVPPDPEKSIIERGEESFLEKKSIPRIEILTQLLEENGIPTNRYFCIEGVVNKEMMRKQSYRMFIIPPLEKMLLVCNEEDNATFVINKVESPELFDKVSLEEYYSRTKNQLIFYCSLRKSQLKALKKTGIVEQIDWSSNVGVWEEKILDVLTKPVNPKLKSISTAEICELIREKVREKVREKAEFLSFEEAKKIVKTLNIMSQKEYFRRYKEGKGLP